MPKLGGSCRDAATVFFYQQVCAFDVLGILEREFALQEQTPAPNIESLKGVVPERAPLGVHLE